MEHLTHAKQEIFDMYIKLIHQQEQQESIMEKRMSVQIENMEQELGSELKLNMSDIHAIACIGDYEPINVTSIAGKMGLSKATVSRITAKLIKKDSSAKPSSAIIKKKSIFA